MVAGCAHASTLMKLTQFQAVGKSQQVSQPLQRVQLTFSRSTRRRSQV